MKALSLFWVFDFGMSPLSATITSSRGAIQFPEPVPHLLIEWVVVPNYVETVWARERPRALIRGALFTLPQRNLGSLASFQQSSRPMTWSRAL